MENPYIWSVVGRVESATPRFRQFYRRMLVVFAMGIGLSIFPAQAIPKLAFGKLTDSYIDTEKSTVTFIDGSDRQTLQFAAFDFYEANRMSSDGFVPLEPLWQMPEVAEPVKEIARDRHLYFNGWMSDGHVYGGWELVMPGTRSMPVPRWP